jgi:hypothetical protein
VRVRRPLPEPLRPAAILGVIATLSACGPKEAPRTATPAPTHIDATPASGDLAWTIGDTSRPLRSGAALVGPGGRLLLYFSHLALAETDRPCDARDALRNPSGGPERVFAEVPRGLDAPYPLGRTVSPEPLQLLPLAKGVSPGAAPRVFHHGLELTSIDWKPGGRVLGRVAWMSSSPATFGEGRFDLPLCATQKELDALEQLPKTHPVAPTGLVKGRTATTSFTLARAFAEIAPHHDLPPHPARLELYSDPLVTCETRHAGKGVTLFVDIDPETALGRRNATRQPIRAVECASGTLRFACFGDRDAVHGFVDLRETDLRVGGAVRGTLAVEGEGTASVAGTFDVELCKPDS